MVSIFSKQTIETRLGEMVFKVTQILSKKKMEVFILQSQFNYLSLIMLSAVVAFKQDIDIVRPYCAIAES